MVNCREEGHIQDARLATGGEGWAGSAHGLTPESPLARSSAWDLQQPTQGAQVVPISPVLTGNAQVGVYLSVWHTLAVPSHRCHCC